MTIVVIWLLFWVPFAIIVGVGANKRGRSGFGFFLFSVAFSPILGAVLLWAVGSRAPRKERVKVYQDQRKRIDWKAVDWSPDAAQNAYQVRDELNRKADNRRWMFAGAVCVGLIVLLVVLGNKPEQPYHQAAGQPLDLAQTLSQKCSGYTDFGTGECRSNTVIIHPDKNNLRESTTAYWDKDKGWIRPPSKSARLKPTSIRPEACSINLAMPECWEEVK